jgi:hypothetical protein
MNEPIQIRIVHLEDEPHDVNQYPSLIESAINRWSGVKDSVLNSSDDNTSNVIEFSDGIQSFEVLYHIVLDLDGFETDALRAAALYIVDVRFGSDGAKGFEIVDTLTGLGVPIEKIWFLTGYSIKAQYKYYGQALKPKIISKPASPDLIRTDMLSLIQERILLEAGHELGW